jgi:hypothetical protein
MSVQQCSLCRRPAAWSIQKEIFCELHKEEIIARHGVDQFPVKRVSSLEKQFTVRGRHQHSAPTTSSRQK